MLFLLSGSSAAGKTFVLDELRRRGLEASDIAVVVLTHLHEDHASAIELFPDAQFVLSATEWEAATSGRLPLLRGYHPSHYDFAFDYATIDFDADFIESYGPFGRSFDLFADGSVHLAYTPGHSAGHISLICRLRERDFVIGGDAVYTEGQLDGSAPLPPRPFDAHNFRRSLQELKLFRDEYPQAIVTPGHDPSFYAKLDARYE